MEQTNGEIRVRLRRTVWTPEIRPPFEFDVFNIVSELEPLDRQEPLNRASRVELGSDQPSFWNIKENQKRVALDVSLVHFGNSPYTNFSILLPLENSRPFRFFADDMRVLRWDEAFNSGYAAFNLPHFLPGDENAFTFFISNQSPFVVSLSFPQSIECYEQDNTRRLAASIESLAQLPIVLDPHITDPSQVEKRHTLTGWDREDY